MTSKVTKVYFYVYFFNINLRSYAQLFVLFKKKRLIVRVKQWTTFFYIIEGFLLKKSLYFISMIENEIWMKNNSPAIRGVRSRGAQCAYAVGLRLTMLQIYLY
jgi:hypothetical protein